MRRNLVVDPLLRVSLAREIEGLLAVTPVHLPSSSLFVQLDRISLILAHPELARLKEAAFVPRLRWNFISIRRRSWDLSLIEQPKLAPSGTHRLAPIESTAMTECGDPARWTRRANDG
jgi:hypothetical protein